MTRASALSSSPRRLLAVLLLLGVPLLAFAPTVGAAGKKASKPGLLPDGGKLPAASLPDQIDHYDPDNVTGMSRYLETCIVGNNRFVSHDYAGAVEQYKKAIPMAPKNALGSYLLAEGLIALDKVAESKTNPPAATVPADRLVVIVV